MCLQDDKTNERQKYFNNRLASSKSEIAMGNDCIIILNGKPMDNHKGKFMLFSISPIGVSIMTFKCVDYILCLFLFKI